MPSRSDEDLQAYFTDVEHLRELLAASIVAPVLKKRLFVIHGVGGVGKSSLLRMFRLHCKSAHVPVALASGDEAKSALDVLTTWSDDLKADSIALPTFDKTLEHHRAILARVDDQARKSQDARGRMADIAGRATSKTAETAAGALVGAALGTAIPGLGTAIGGALGGVLGGMSADWLVDWLRGFLKKPDIDLLLDPARKLTVEFLADMAQSAEKRRHVLMLDTYEQMTGLDDWVRDFAQQLHSNVLLVIAGRAVPDWNRAWPGWIARAQVEESNPVTEDVMRNLVRRYYATVRGGEPDPTQVEAIIRFARGLPIVATSAVQLWVKYGIEDFQSVKAEIIPSLVDRLMEGVSPALVPALEAAAAVRWFDQPILRAVTGLPDVREAYNELRRFPFVRVRVEGLAVHDAVREIIDENTRAQDSERHAELHERAAAYFERQLEKAGGEEAERLRLEQLYHRVSADEQTGIKLFQEIAEGLARHHLTNSLRTLVNDVNTYPLDRENSRLWRDFYNAELVRHKGQAYTEELERVYSEIIARTHADPRLRGKALLNCAAVLSRDERKTQPGTADTIRSMLEECERTLPDDDSERHTVLIRKSTFREASFHNTHTSLLKVFDWCLNRNDYYALASTCEWIKGYSAMHGRWREFLDIERKVLGIPEVTANPMLKARTLSGWQIARIWMGRYTEAENILREVIEIRGGPNQQDGISRDLLYSIAAQRRSREVIPLFETEREKYRLVGRDAIYDLAWVQRLLGIAYLAVNDDENAKKCLSEAVQISDHHVDPYRVHEDAYFLGLCCMARREWLEAEQCFARYLVFPFDDWHLYFKCGALVGLMYIKEALGRRIEIATYLPEIESLASSYGYNDHIAMLRLLQGVIIDDTDPDRHGPASSEIADGLGNLSGLDYFKQAMLYALRYNRFLLDDVLSGQQFPAPSQPIILHCLARGERGRQILAALRDWWQTGTNEIGVPWPEIINPLPEGIPLVEAERIARDRERGDGSPQKTVVDQIESILQQG